MIIPKHVAIIMDGNGRWGLKKKNNRNFGHKEGLNTAKKIILEFKKRKIKFLTLFAFSTENWKRPANEIKYLLLLLENYIDNELSSFSKENIKIKFLGNLNKFPKPLKKKLYFLEKKTTKNFLLQVNIALNYGSRDEILYAVKFLNKNNIKITEDNLSKSMYTKNIPDPEILIRTGGYKRLSNFLSWQTIYSEIFFIKKLWPDFNKKDLNNILISFNKIKRNFGNI